MPRPGYGVDGAARAQLQAELGGRARGRGLVRGVAPAPPGDQRAAERAAAAPRTRRPRERGQGPGGDQIAGCPARRPLLRAGVDDRRVGATRGRRARAAMNSHLRRAALDQRDRGSRAGRSRAAGRASPAPEPRSAIAWPRATAGELQRHQRVGQVVVDRGRADRGARWGRADRRSARPAGPAAGPRRASRQPVCRGQLGQRPAGAGRGAAAGPAVRRAQPRAVARAR